MHNKSYVNQTSDLAGIQTLDLQNRNLTLYSAKLRGHNVGAKVNIIHGIGCKLKVKTYVSPC